MFLRKWPLLLWGWLPGSQLSTGLCMPGRDRWKVRQWRQLLGKDLGREIQAEIAAIPALAPTRWGKEVHSCSTAALHRPPDCSKSSEGSPPIPQSGAAWKEAGMISQTTICRAEVPSAT